MTEKNLHVAIIMDGNGRWAKEQGLPRLAGHRAGAKTVRSIVTHAREQGIRYLTLFAFSSENWGRPPLEVTGLMKLLEEYLRDERETMIENEIELKAIGAIEKLPLSVKRELKETEEETAGFEGMRLTLALSYGARSEILRAVRSISEDVAAGVLKASQVNEDVFNQHLFTHDLPEPDLLIRTSGEHRISNFLLWQSAYSELVFIEKPWPIFQNADFDAAIEHFRKRERRYGLTADQINDTCLKPAS